MAELEGGRPLAECVRVPAWVFDGWAAPLRTVALGVSGYAVLVMILRVSGKRTLSKLNAFDLVVTVALGSCLATVMLSSTSSLAQGIAGFGTLAFLQTLVAWLSSRSRAVGRLVRSEPALLLHRGEMLRAAMQSERVTSDEILAAVRSAGIGRLADAEAVVIESSGALTCIRRSDGRATALDGIDRGG